MIILGKCYCGARIPEEQALQVPVEQKAKEFKQSGAEA
jgi:hypothetical protein